MNNRFHLIGVSSVCVLLLAGFAAKSSSKPPPETPAVCPDQAEETHSVGQESAYDQQDPARLRELSRVELEQRRRNLAREKMKSYREDAQFTGQARWSSMLSTNWQTFRALRDKAAHSPKREVPCTLCDGRGTMRNCALCSGLKGKCATCRGSGTLSVDEYCPTCLGSGKCFLCAGTKKMTCPFCDDGVISLKHDLPPQKIPIE